MSVAAVSERKPPSKLKIIKECRAVLDLASVPFSLLASKFSDKQIKGALPIIMFPGFGSDERYLKFLQRYLTNLGYQTEGWGLGVNLAGLNLKHNLDDLSPRWEFDFPEGYTEETYKGEGGVAFLCDKAIDRVKRRSTELNSPVVIIGWSLGGYIAREVARELPDEVAQIITFGTPVIGGPKYSRAADYFKSKNFDLDWIEKSIEKRDQNPITQPITAIYSKSDGVVSSFASIDTVSPRVKNIEVNSAHLGMAFNHKIWSVVRNALSEEARKREDKH